jgi:perosamine synthetase
VTSRSSEPILPVAEPDLSELEERYVLDAVRSGWVSSIGPYVDRFEELVAGMAGTSCAVAVSNGTVALHLALVARGIGPGAEVIVPDLTFAATAAAVVHAGATPVLVDVRRDTWCIDPELVEQAITQRTRAIIAVHLFGHPAEMTELAAIAKGHGLLLIEDAAEAHGARHAGKPVGSLGDVGCFSFYGNKLVTTGEGGALTTDDADYAARLRFLKDHAMRPQRRYFHEDAGYNYRITNLQAALGCAQLERFDAILAKKSALLSVYRATCPREDLVLNPVVAPAQPVCWLVCALLPQTHGHSSTANVLARMKAEHGVDSRPFFLPMHTLPPYASATLIKRDRSVAAELADRGVCLPSSNKLRETDVARVWTALASSL